MKQTRYPKSTLSRRHFLRQTAVTTASLSLAMPYLRSAEAAIGEGERAGIRVGCIGVGNQGKMHLLRNHKNVVAVSEVDSDRLAVARKEIEDRTGRKCAAFTDYRDLLESKDVDRIRQATETLTQESHRIAQVMYEAAKGQEGAPGPDGQPGPGPQTPGGQEEEPEVVDAEFEEK